MGGRSRLRDAGRSPVAVSGGPGAGWEIQAADLVLVVHFAIFLFITLSLPLIWIGRFLGWRFVRSLAYRLVHLGLIAFVALQALLGRLCPLTLWEARLRESGRASGTPPVSFVRQWVGRILFVDAEPWVFTIAYVMFLGLVIMTWALVPPRPRGGGRRHPPPDVAEANDRV